MSILGTFRTGPACDQSPIFWMSRMPSTRQQSLIKSFSAYIELSHREPLRNLLTHFRTCIPDSSHGACLRRETTESVPHNFKLFNSTLLIEQFDIFSHRIESLEELYWQAILLGVLSSGYHFRGDTGSTRARACSQQCFTVLSAA
jgi:hypothetical protein